MNFLSKALLAHRYSPVTENGTLPISNGSSEQNPFFGTGQGSSDGTTGWGIIHDKIDEL